MIEKKYVCVGGYVYSNDNEEHFIDAFRLPKLYGVRPLECHFDKGEYLYERFYKYLNLKVLRPKATVTIKFHKL